jgi:hypothetical protein
MEECLGSVGKNGNCILGVDEAGILFFFLLVSQNISQVVFFDWYSRTVRVLDKPPLPTVRRSQIVKKGLVPRKALEMFDQMNRMKTSDQLLRRKWKLALEVSEEIEAAGHRANVLAYCAAISASSKGQHWYKALELSREIDASRAL